jgi:glc operon protein GlcG
LRARRPPCRGNADSEEYHVRTALPALLIAAPFSAYASPSTSLPTRPILTLDAARAIVSAAEANAATDGGLPITVDHQIVGAIGVSADIPRHDEQIARAGVAALAQ